MLQFENQVGKRETKSNFEEVVVAEVTAGHFRLSPKVVEKLGVQDGSAITVQKAGDVYYIGKGKDATLQKNEDGTYATDARGRRIAVEGQEGFGATARELSPGSNILRFSTSAAWMGVGATGEVKKVFKLGEGVETTLNTGNGTLTTVLYPLVWERDEPKTERGQKSEDEGENLDAEATQRAVQNAAIYDDEEL